MPACAGSCCPPHRDESSPGPTRLPGCGPAPCHHQPQPPQTTAPRKRAGRCYGEVPHRSTSGHRPGEPDAGTPSFSPGQAPGPGRRTSRTGSAARSRSCRRRRLPAPWPVAGGRGRHPREAAAFKRLRPRHGRRGLGPVWLLNAGEPQPCGWGSRPNECPAVTYSPTPSRVQYHRRCGS